MLPCRSQIRLHAIQQSVHTSLSCSNNIVPPVLPAASPALGDGSAQFEKRTGNHTHMPLDRLCILQVSVDEEELDRGQSQPATVREPTIAARMAACSKCHLAAPCTYLEVGAFAAECAVDVFSAEFDRIASMHQPPGTPFTSFPAVLGCCRDVSSSELRHGWF